MVPAQKAGSRRMKGSRLARDAQPDPVSKTNKLQQGLMRRLHQIGVNTPRESDFHSPLICKTTDGFSE